MIDDNGRATRIVDVASSAAGILTLTIRPEDGAPVDTWEPGAHIEVLLPSGRRRHYSLCGDPRDTSAYTIAVLLDDAGRGGSIELHSLARPGVELSVSEPRNNFTFHRGSEYLFVAGGIGVTPLLPMIADAEERGANWRLIYGGRCRESMAFTQELLAYGADRVALYPQDVVGLPPLGAELKAVTENTHVYCCGPPAMLDAVAIAHTQTGRPSDLLHFERFSADPGATPPTENQPFRVALARSGVEVEVTSEQTLLEALLSVAPEIAYSCEDGYCGSCETAVLDGQPDHRDTYLTEEERAANDVMMICVSRCNSPLLLLDL